LLHTYGQSCLQNWRVILWKLMSIRVELVRGVLARAALKKTQNG